MKRREVPSRFCWTRFGTEAAEPIDAILRRKEQERLLNGGVFLWGIGNAIGPSMAELVRRESIPEVLFSPMKSAPKCKDVAPAAVATWTSATGLDGRSFELPGNSVVTSRFDILAPKKGHYALVCYSEAPLALDRGEGTLSFNKLRNILTGRPVGASQVTAVVEHSVDSCLDLTTYDVAIRASLIAPYFVRLADPVWHRLNCDALANRFTTVRA
jgi:hypothetical protein